jgi:hypothetical protein
MLLKDLHGGDSKKAVTPAAKLELSQRLLHEGDTEETDLAAKFLLLKDSADLAANSGNLFTMEQALSDLTGTFDFDGSK